MAKYYFQTNTKVKHDVCYVEADSEAEAFKKMYAGEETVVMEGVVEDAIEPTVFMGVNVL